MTDWRPSSYRSFRWREPLGQVFEAEGVAVFDGGVGAFKEFKEDIGDADVGEGAAEGFGPQIEEELVMLARVDVDGLHRGECSSVQGDHAHGVPGEPAFPHFGNEHTRRCVVGQVDGTVNIGGIAGGHAPVVEQGAVAFPVKGRAGAEILPELLE